MENHTRLAPETYHLVWVFPGNIDQVLDAVTWVETMRELQKIGRQVTLLSAGQSNHTSYQDLYIRRIHRQRGYFLRQLDFHLKIMRLLSRDRDLIDVIMFHQLSAPWLLTLKVFMSLSKDFRPLFVMDTRDLHPLGGNWKHSLRRTFIRFSHFLANRLADGQMAISDRMADLVNINPSELWGVWPSGVIPQRFSIARERREWPQEDDPVKLVYIGRLQEERNLSILCEAVNEVNRRGFNFNLLFIGEGPYRQSLSEYAKMSDSHLHIVDSVPYAEIPKRLGDSHIGVTSLPSPSNVKYGASSPLKMFEYMAAGMPILATSNPCHTDVVGKQDYAFWINDVSVSSSVSALERIWESRNLLRQMGDEASAAVESWTWRASAAKLDTAIQKGLIKSGSPKIKQKRT
jgi:glycosyltransferase involved in cell wall biosynthesis